jgi:hypothetical protein
VSIADEQALDLFIEMSAASPAQRGAGHAGIAP